MRRRSRSASGWRARLVWFRAGQLLGLLFLIGPLSDLGQASLAPARVAALSVSLAAFVALYLALLPPVRSIAERGRRAVCGGLVLLAALAVLVLALGAPRSCALLFAYVVAAAGMALPSAWAVAVTGVTAAAVGSGLAVAGASGSTVSAYTLTILAVGAIMVAMGSTTRANRELRAARDELARLAVSEERLRIARDLHDLLGHTLSLIALKSELATRLVVDDPDRAQAELTDVQRVTRQALADVREAVRGYRRFTVVDALESARDARRRRDRLPRRTGRRALSERRRERARVGRSRGDHERRPSQRRARLHDHALDRCGPRRAAGRG